MLLGDVRVMLRSLPADHFDCVVTSPPYWGLRDYGVEGQIGLERTLGEHLDVMVGVFDEVRRVMKPSGTLWINYGDCYATTPNGRSAADTRSVGNDDRVFRDKPFSTIGPIYVAGYEKTSRIGTGSNKNHIGSAHGGRVVAGGYLKPGDLCMIPNRLAIALQDAGWWIKAENIWGKQNPMPDSNGSTRPSTAHEKIWMLTKSNRVKLWRARDTGELSFNPDLAERCMMRSAGREGPRWIRMPHYYDACAVAMPVSENTHARVSQNVEAQIGSARANGGTRADRPMKAVVRTTPKAALGGSRTRNNESFEAALRGTVKERFLRNYEPAPLQVWQFPTHSFSEAHFATFPPELVERCIAAGCPPGGLVLDPFGGAGTTGLVAAALGRQATLIELNPEYAKLARARIEASFMGRHEGERHLIKQLGRDRAPFSQDSLFAGLEAAE